jgi:hypothetical protein
MDLLTRQCCINGGIQVRWPTHAPPWLIGWDHLQAQRGQIVRCGQRGDLGLLGLTDDLAMGAHEAADHGVGERSSVVRLPAEETGNRGKGQLLG